MRAVNLIPVEDRRGAGAPGRSGGAVYGLLGALTLVVLMVAAVFATTHSVKAKQQQLSTVNAQAQAAEAQAGSLQAYTQFASLREKRQQTVASLAASRFDWAHSLHELARTLPAGTSLTGLRATVSPSATVQGGTSDPLRAALNQPALELQGCATSQAGTAEVAAAMRRMDGVQRVSLSSSETNAKGTAAGGAAGAGAPSSGGAGNGDCRAGSTKRSQFSMTVFYAAPTPAAGTATGATTAAASTTPAATTTQPTTGGTK